MTDATATATEPAATAPALQLGRFFAGRRPMSLGLMLPIADQDAYANDSPVAGFAEMAALARLAVEVGFEALWLPDHFILQLEREGNRPRGVWECWTTCAALAAVPGVTIGVLVACTGFHSPGSIAKMAESIDAISGGRFVLGLGCGWHKPEYDRYGYPFDHRVDRFEEALQIISPLLRQGEATFEGRYYQARGAVNYPRGPRWEEGGPPILIGANRPRMLRLTARFADVWNADWQHDPATVAAQSAELDRACAEVGRDPAGLVRTAGSNFELEGATGRRFEPISGTPEQMAAKIREFADLGLAHYVCGLEPCTPRTLEQFAGVIRALDGG